MPAIFNLENMGSARVPLWNTWYLQFGPGGVITCALLHNREICAFYNTSRHHNLTAASQEVRNFLHHADYSCITRLGLEIIHDSGHSATQFAPQAEQILELGVTQEWVVPLDAPELDDASSISIDQYLTRMRRNESLRSSSPLISTPEEPLPPYAPLGSDPVWAVDAITHDSTYLVPPSVVASTRPQYRFNARGVVEVVAPILDEYFHIENSGAPEPTRGRPLVEGVEDWNPEFNDSWDFGDNPLPSWNRFSVSGSNQSDIVIKLWKGNTHVYTYGIRRSDSVLSGYSPMERRYSFSLGEMHNIRAFLAYAMHYVSLTGEQTTNTASTLGVFGLPGELSPHLFKVAPGEFGGDTWARIVQNLILLEPRPVAPKCETRYQSHPGHTQYMNYQGGVLDRSQGPLINIHRYGDYRTERWNHHLHRIIPSLFEGGVPTGDRCRNCFNRVNPTTDVEVVDDVSCCRSCSKKCDYCEKRHIHQIAPNGNTLNPFLRILNMSGKQRNACVECTPTITLHKCESCNTTYDTPLPPVEEFGMTPSASGITHACTHCLGGNRRCKIGKEFIACNEKMCNHEAKGVICCEKCWSIDYVRCSDCGDNRKRGAVAHPDGLCSRCEGVHFKRYNYKPAPRFQSLEHEVEPLFMGIELELEIKKKLSNREDAAGYQQAYSKDMARDLGNLFYFKGDGSLRHQARNYCRDGIEIVTHPMSLEFFRSNGFADKLNALTNRFRAYKSTRCGMHVHVPKAAFEGEHLTRFVLFHYQNKEFIRFVGQRRENHYSQFGNHTKGHIVERSGNKAGLQHEKYEALNLNNKHTVELRYFKANLIAKRLLKNLEFIQALYEFTKTCTDADVTLNRFIQFVNGNANYAVLAQFISDRNKLFLFEDDEETEEEAGVLINDTLATMKPSYYVQNLTSNHNELDLESLCSMPVFDLS